MINIHLYNNKGFSWYKSDTIAVKGYLTDDDGHYIAKEQLLEFAKINLECNNIDTLLTKSNGFFSIVQKTESRVIASVDLLRSIPLFYALDKAVFYLSDDANWVRKQLQDKEMDNLSEEEFLLTSYVTGSDTLYPLVKQLQAGEYLVFDKQKKQLALKRYFEFRHNNFSNKSDEEMMKELDNVHVGVFQRLIKSLNGRPAVVPLSAGEDSRLIVSMLKRLGYENVICFSYGKPNNQESKVSEQIANYLGYKWFFVPYSNNKWHKWYYSTEWEEYNLYATNISNLAHIQDFPAVCELKKQKLIPQNSIFIPGHAGDFVAGSHIPQKFLESKYFTLSDIQEAIYHYHYVLWPSKIKKLHDNFDVKNNSLIKVKHSYTPEEAANEFEKWDWQERQAKFIVNSIRVYEYYNYEWRLPLWDKEIIDFWSKVRIKQRFGRKLYFKYSNKYLNVSNKSQNVSINVTNTYLKKIKSIIRNFLSNFPVMYRFTKLLTMLNGYYSNPMAFYGIVSYTQYLYFCIKGMVSINSMLTLFSIKSLKSTSKD